MRQLILLLLSMAIATIVLADSNCPKYDRKSYRHWVDEDRDCQNARHEVLIEESLSTVVFKSAKGCRVVSGSWDDPYSGRTITDATKLDIDHMGFSKKHMSLALPIGQGSAKEPMPMI